MVAGVYAELQPRTPAERVIVWSEHIRVLSESLGQLIPLLRCQRGAVIDQLL